MARERIIVIDGSGYFFRAFFAIRQLSTSKGFPTNAVFGFINMLMKVLDNEKPTKLAIAFDTAKPSFRKERYAEYKSNRSAPPEDLVKQIPYIFRAVDAFGIPRLEKPGFEADDIIGTLATRAVKDGYSVEIITGDKDLMQLVSDDVRIYDTMKDKRIDADGVKERFGVTPAQVVDLLALMGDSSDNIPGVSGIGEKTAAELINQFGSLDGIYRHLDEIKQPKRRETLAKEKETAYLSQELATVQCDMDLSLDWSTLDYRGPKLDELQALFTELEFTALLKRFGLKTGDSPASGYVKGSYETVRDEARLKEILGELARSPRVAVDTETTSLTVQSASLVGVSLAGHEGKAYYVPVGHRAPAGGERLADQIPEARARELLKPFLEDAKIPKIGQNLKYDMQILRRWGIELRGIEADTLIASYLIDPSAPHNLDALALRYLGHQNITYEEVAGKGKAQISFAEVPLDKATEYSGEDADVTLRLHGKLVPDLEKQQLTRLFHDVEMPLVDVLAEMEYCGVLIDAPRLSEMGESLQDEMAAVESRVHGFAGGPFNINSPKQLSQVLFEKLKLPVIRKTKTGISTDENVLQQLCSQHEICTHILKYRELQKLRSTYVEGLLAEIHPETGRVHTSYNQTVTATGRLSSSNPNLQNIPVGGDKRYDIRSVFVCEEGHELLSADYSQVELRLMADMSGDRELSRAFLEDQDVHEFTGRLIFGTSTITPEQRRIAKTINFGVIYGQTPFGLSQTLKIPPGQAKDFIEAYFKRYTGVQAFLKKLVEEARAKGYVTTLLGRRRHFPDIRSENRMTREMAERAAINAPIQGTAADMIKKAMVSLHRRLRLERLRARMILQVHDELVFEVPVDEKKRVEAIVRDEMEHALNLNVPLKVDMGWGKNWGETG